MDNKKTLAVLQALGQAAAKAYPGALDDAGVPREDLPVGDSNSAFKISFAGRNMILRMQEEMPLSDVQDKNFETEVKQKMADIVKFLKKEYRKMSGSSVALSKQGKTEVLIQSLSRFRSWVNASEVYEIGSLDKDTENAHEKLDESIRKFLSEGSKKEQDKGEEQDVVGDYLASRKGWF